MMLSLISLSTFSEHSAGPLPHSELFEKDHFTLKIDQKVSMKSTRAVHWRSTSSLRTSKLSCFTDRSGKHKVRKGFYAAYKPPASCRLPMSIILYAGLRHPNSQAPFSRGLIGSELPHPLYATATIPVQPTAASPQRALRSSYRLHLILI